MRERKNLIKYFTIKHKKFLPVKTLIFIEKDLGLFEAILVIPKRNPTLSYHTRKNAHAIHVEFSKFYWVKVVIMIALSTFFVCFVSLKKG